MMYDYNFGGMHMLWWFFWVVSMVFLFGWFVPVPKRRIRHDSPLEILQKRFATGEITTEEYKEKKIILETDLAKNTK
ncbi:hypothetical protein BH10ACI2_BH10ACI2_21850 [soil metagenome]